VKVGVTAKLDALWYGGHICEQPITFKPRKYDSMSPISDNKIAYNPCYISTYILSTHICILEDVQ